MIRTCIFLASVVLFTQAFGFEPPAENHYLVCIEFECDQKARITLDANDWRQIHGLFSSVVSAEQERRQITRYIALMETLSGRQTETWRDRGKNDPNVEPLGQLDCIAESTNTTTYLRLLQSSGLLRWHSVGERQVRNPGWLIPHWTAVIVEKESGRAYAVDSWFLPNGQRPVILPLQDWLAGEDGPKG